MITPVNQHSTYPSYFFITDDTVDVPLLPKCVISSLAVNTVNNSVWTVQICTSDATKLAWHKIGSSTEVVCS